MSGSLGSSSGADQEFIVRVPLRNPRKSHHVIKFNRSLRIDFTKWAQGTVRMVRENVQKSMKNREEEMPKFGAGSEFGREEREEARRKKYGITSRKHKPEAQPWLIRVGDKKTGKRYRGVREGGVADNTTYYVFTHAQDGAFEAHPIKEWYNFTPIQTYTTYNAEEAEVKFAERGKILNHWAMVVSKKLRPNVDNDDDLDDDEKKKSKKGSKKSDSSFKISDMDDWVESGDELDTDSDSDTEKKKKKKNDDEDSGQKKDKKDAKKKKKKSKEDVENEAFEDSDDGDDECREVDYMSDESSDSEGEINEKNDEKGVDQDEGLNKMLDSEDSESEDEEEQKKAEKKRKAAAAAAAGVNEDNGGEDGGGVEESGAGEDREGGGDEGKKKKSKNSKPSSHNNSRPPSPSDKTENRTEKRKAMIDNLLDPSSEPSAKKSRLEPFGSGSSHSGAPLTQSEALLEDDVRRYLTRKPMTTTELVKKICSKKPLSKEELMPLLVNVLKKVNPHKQKVKGIMYLSLKTDK